MTAYSRSRAWLLVSAAMAAATVASAGAHSPTPAAAAFPAVHQAALLAPAASAASETGLVPRGQTTSGAAQARNARLRPPAAERASRATRPKVAVVGDSLTVELAELLDKKFSRQGWRLSWVDARVGRGTSEGLDILRTRHWEGTAVVALGTNDYSASEETVRSWIREASRIAGKSRRVAWINLHMDPDAKAGYANFRTINAHLKEATRGVPNVRVFDWAAFAAREGVSLGSDGVHYPWDTFPQRAFFYVAAALRAYEVLPSRPR